MVVVEATPARCSSVIMGAMGRPSLAAVRNETPARSPRRRAIRTALTADLRDLDVEGRRTLAALARGLAECADQAVAAGDGYRLAQLAGELRKTLNDLLPAEHDLLDDLLLELSRPIDENTATPG